jgi:hypothetical protein
MKIARGVPRASSMSCCSRSARMRMAGRDEPASLPLKTMRPLSGSWTGLQPSSKPRRSSVSAIDQRARSRLISIWELVRDAFGDLFELDSRLWKTLVPLMISPGKLTHDYLQGRRARYMPPFRMYLVLSLLFFLVAFFDPRETFGLFYDPQTLEQQEEEERRHWHAGSTERGERGNGRRAQHSHQRRRWCGGGMPGRRLFDQRP